MEYDTPVRGSLAFNATEAKPRIHTDHSGGTYSLALTDELSPVSVYVRGTADELLDLAARIVATVAIATPAPSSQGKRPSERVMELVQWQTDCGNVDDQTGRPLCVDCGAVMAHDQGPYWWCNRSDCPAYRHTILFAGGTRAHVGMMS